MATDYHNKGQTVRAKHVNHSSAMVMVKQITLTVNI